MKITLSRGQLFDILSVAGRGLSSRSTLPILSGILLSADDNGTLSVQATDLEVSVQATVPSAVERPGSAVLPGKLVTDIVRSLPESAVTIDVEGQSASVSSGTATFSVKTLSPEDFPKFPEIEAQEEIELPASALADAVKHVSKAVSRDETRPILTGVLMSIEGPVLRLVATDSYRLAVREVVLEKSTDKDLEVVAPGRALEEVSRLASSEGEVKIGVSENQIVFSFGETTFVTRRIEGSFPNYRQLIPRDIETTVTVPRDELLEAVKRVSLLAQHNTPLRVSVVVQDQTVNLQAATQDVGDASEDLMVSVEGQDVEIAFNHAFLVDGITSSDGDELRIEIVSSLKPGVLRPKEGDDFLYLLMPVRVG